MKIDELELLDRIKVAHEKHSVVWVSVEELTAIVTELKLTRYALEKADKVVAASDQFESTRSKEDWQVSIRAKVSYRKARGEYG